MTAAASPIRNSEQRGFTYVSVVILVAIIGLVVAASLRLGTTMQRVAAEQELLNIGMEYSNALASYAAATPSGQPNYPNSFAELLKDPRFPQLRRHLRRVYVDPLTGKAEWGIMKANENGGILAIYSLSKAAPIKIGNFPPRFVAFEGKANLGDWKFSGEGVQVPGAKGAEQADGQQPNMPAKPGSGMLPGTTPGMTPGTTPGTPIGSPISTPSSSKPGTPQEPPKPVEPEPEPEPQQEPQEPQEPPPQPAQDPQSEPSREEAPPPPSRR